MTTLTLGRVPLTGLTLHARFGVWFAWVALLRWLRLETRLTTNQHARSRRAVMWPELVWHYVVAVFVVTTFTVDATGAQSDAESAMCRWLRFTLRGVVFVGVTALTWWLTW